MSQINETLSFSHQGKLPQQEALDVKCVAAMLGCTEKHVYNLEKKKLMPSKVKLGTLSRWPRKTIQEWIDGGCRPQNGE